MAIQKINGIASEKESVPIINGNFDDLVNMTGNLRRESKLELTQHITGYEHGSITFIRRGDLVLVNFAVELGEIKVYWNIVHCPDGYKPGASAAEMHVALLGDLELKLNAYDFVAQNNANNRWWVGQASYFTYDDFPA